MKLLSRSILSGFNVHHDTSVIQQEVELGAFAGMSSGSAGPGFSERFVDRFCGLETLVPIPGGGMPDAFLERLNSAEGAPFVEVLFQAILAVETSMAFALRRLDAIGYSEILSGKRPDRVLLVWRCRIPEISRRAARIGLIGLEELLPTELRKKPDAGEGRFERAYDSLWRYARRRKLSPSTTLLAQTADRKGIPWESMGGQTLCLGQGRFQHRFVSTMTDETTFQAMKFASNKHVCNRFLADLRLPVPRQAKADSVEQALSAAKAIGYPVVVKPVSSKKGAGVSAGLKGPDEIPVAFERASRARSGVIVEAFVEGQDHRLLVIDGRFVAGTKRLPPTVTGDGARTIAELIEELNQDPYRDSLRRCPVKRDEELKRLLARAGYGLDTVLEEGEIFALRSTANVSTGGCAIDVTDRVHPDNREMAIRAIEAIGLDVGGVDFLTTDIGRSYKEGGGIVEVNARPGLRPHTWPVEGEPRDVAGAMLEAFFPPGDQGRVPVALIAGGVGSGRVARGLDHILRSAGMTVGLVTTDGAFINGDPAGPEGAARPKATRAVLRDPRVEALVSTVSPRRAVRGGLVHDACEVAAIMGSTAGSRSVKETRRGLELVVRATRGKLVVRAGSRRALEAVEGVDPDRLILVSRNAANRAFRRHLEAGGLAVMTARDRGARVIVLIQGDRTLASLPIKAVPALSVRDSRARLDAHLFAVALAHGMGLSGKEIVSVLRNGRPAEKSASQTAVAEAATSAVMKITGTDLLHAHNIYSERSVVRLHLEISPREFEKSDFEEVGTRLRDTLGAALGTVQGDPPESDPGSLVAWAATELQRSLGSELKAVSPASCEHDAGTVAVFECEDLRVGVLAGRLAVKLTRRLLQLSGRGRGSKARNELKAQIAQFCRRASALTLRVQDREVVRAARERGIEVLPLTGRLFQLGQGRFQQRIYGSSTSRLNHLSSRIVSNKDYTKRFLHDLGLPVARYERVRGPKQAVAAAERIGYPVVIKPNQSNLGRGVSIGVRDAEGVAEACRIAQRLDKSILVEELIEGQDHRLLVIDGKAVAASRRVPAHVVGDGRSTVTDLVAAANDDPRRRAKQQGAWTALSMDDTALRILERQGISPDSVPPAGRAVYLRAVANTSSGGTAVDITDEIHGENLRIAERAAVAMGMDIAGVDILAPDISRPLSETGGVICEINSKPGLRKHIWPAEGRPRDVIGPLLDMLFPARENEQFRTVSIVAQENQESVVQIVSRVLERAGHSIVTSSSNGFTRNRSLESMERDDPVAAARRAFLDPFAEGAILLTTPRDLMAQGLGYSSCSVGVWIGPDQPCESAPMGSYATALRLLSSATRGTLVVGVDDPDGLPLASETAIPTCYVVSNPSSKAVRSYLDRGVPVLVTVRTGADGAEAPSDASRAEITIYQNGREDRVSPLDLASAAPEIEASPRQAAFAMAILLGLGMSSAEIREALRQPTVRH